MFTCGRWVAKRDVLFVSTVFRNEIEHIERRGSEGALETVSNPKIITDYNCFMSGVDKADQLMVHYTCGRKSYKRIF